MSGKPLSITQKQVTAILKGAEKAGVHLQIVAEKGKVRFLPTDKLEDRPAVDSEPRGYL